MAEAIVRSVPGCWSARQLAAVSFSFHHRARSLAGTSAVVVPNPRRRAIRQGTKAGQRM